MVAADFNFSLSRQKIVEAALRKVGGLSEGEVISDWQKTNAIEALNVLVKSWQTKGVFLWTEYLQLISLTASDDDYDFPITDPHFLSIDKAFIRQSNNDIEVTILSWSDFQEIPDKATTGLPSHLTVDPRNNIVYVWPVPDASYSLYVFGVNKLKDFDTDSGVGDIESRWYRALLYGLAQDLLTEYPVPPNKAKVIIDTANISFAEAKNTERSRNKSDYSGVDSNFPRRGRRC